MNRLIYAAALAFALPAFADDLITYSTDQSFDDVVFGVENAIIDQGLIAENVSHVGEMLERTRDDVGSDVVLFQAAEVFSFCSAAVSRKVMEDDVLNIRFCPYNIFVMQLPDSDMVTIGYRSFPDGAMQDVQALLDTIARSAIGQE
ncbi:DUF302 domain-containing protein [Sulfitobacter sp. MF3-043]|uniref:DUF302 domain-containing protein n=1 Tax=Sulfitobacter sediminivivens TaxID=3252902 RepID=UPI0036DDC616